MSGFWYVYFDFSIYRRIHGNKRYSLRAHHITNLRKMRTMNSSVRTKYSFFLGNESKYLRWRISVWMNRLICMIHHPSFLYIADLRRFIVLLYNRLVHFNGSRAEQTRMTTTGRATLRICIRWRSTLLSYRISV